jgi:predicted amidohydrolase YtcJ
VGINKDTQPPPGGEIIRDASGRPTGVFVDNAQRLVPVPPPDAAQQQNALNLAMEECVSKGVTSFDDAGAPKDVIELYKRYAAAGKLQIRLYAMLGGFDTLRQFERPELGLGGGLLTIRSVKLYADGALGSRGAALLEPYADDPGNSGLLLTPPEQLLEATRYAVGHGFQVCTHAIGDRGNRVILDIYEKAMKEHPEAKDPRLRVEHAQILDAQDIPRFAKLGVIASMQGIHATSDRPWAPARLGMERVTEGAYVWQKLLQSGARVINGTDAPVEDLNPLKCFYASVTRQDESGNPPGGFDPDQRMSREQALRSYTLEPAYGTFQEATLGSIETGKRADLTVLSKDILSVPAPEILKTDVVMTIVDGKVRYQR